MQTRTGTVNRTRLSVRPAAGRQGLADTTRGVPSSTSDVCSERQVIQTHGRGRGPGAAAQLKRELEDVDQAPNYTGFTLSPVSSLPSFYSSRGHSL